MTPYFGKVEEGEVILYQIGKIVERCWYAIPQHHPYVEIDAYVCMPNHVHGIIFITQSVGTKYLSSDKRMNNNSSLRNGAIA
jgi:REP element-mobilizing transposase RayT